MKFRVKAEFALERIRKELSFGKVCTSVVFIDAFENIDREECLNELLLSGSFVACEHNLTAQRREFYLLGIPSAYCETIVTGGRREIEKPIVARLNTVCSLGYVLYGPGIAIILLPNGLRYFKGLF